MILLDRLKATADHTSEDNRERPEEFEEVGLPTPKKTGLVKTSIDSGSQAQKNNFEKRKLFALPKNSMPTRRYVRKSRERAMKGFCWELACTTHSEGPEGGNTSPATSVSLLRSASLSL